MLILFIGLFLITLLSGDAGTTKCPHRCCRDEAHAKKWRTKSQCIPLLFYSLSGNRRVNNFINHITWHDAPKFIVYRNTLNRTQGFTMDTRFCPLHLQQWMTVPRYFVFLFFFFWLFLFFFFLTLITLPFPSVLLLADLQIVGQWHSTLQMLWRSADFCFTSTI